MNPALLLFVLLCVLMFLGIPIAVSLCMSTVAVMVFCLDVNIMSFPQKLFAGADSFPLMAVIFFMIAGELMLQGGISKRLVNFAMSLVGHFTGGLAMVVIVASVFFAAISGSAVATTAAIGAIMIPAMYERGYDPDYACALQATGGIFGPLIPPSIAMVLYAVTANQSVSTMLIAGAGPGTSASVSVRRGTRARNIGAAAGPVPPAGPTRRRTNAESPAIESGGGKR